MEAAAIEDYILFFRDFLELCHAPTWPDASTEREEIRNAFLRAHHIEASIQKLQSEHQRKDEFISLLNTKVDHFSGLFLKNCLSDPSKFILKKIINTEALADSEGLDRLDFAFQQYETIFSQERLVTSLTDLMVEAASKETLLKNISTCLPQDKLKDFQNKLYLLQVIQADSIKYIVSELKDQDCKQEFMDILVKYMLRDDQKISRSKKANILRAFSEVMACRDPSVKEFWKLLFNVEKADLIEMFLRYDKLCAMAFEVLKICYKQIIGNPPPNCCYVEFTFDQLVYFVNKIGENQCLLLQFKEFMEKNDIDVTCFSLEV